MNILIIGSGGREHAIAWKMNQSPHVEKVYVAPGNPGMKNIELVNITDIEKLVNFAEEKNIYLTVVGPEVPLCEGIVDRFREKHLTIFGPNKEAAQLEGSKTYAKNFMAKYNIPTAVGKTFTDCTAALDYVHACDNLLVIKADGLAAGKGVIVAENKEEATEAVKSCFAGRFGSAGNNVLIEERLEGEEASILALCDGKNIMPLATSQDHKRLLEGDKGPNTGGMGAYSPAPVVTAKLAKQIDEQILQNFLLGCQKENLDFRGIIYVGVMITKEGPKVLEFNVRFGDPETQAVLARLESDLLKVMHLTANQNLSEVKLKWSKDTAVTVVMASGGYPGSYEKGYEISGIEAAEKTGGIVFHAGTKICDGKLVNAGGRVLGVTALGSTIQNAVNNAYKAVECISWKDAIYRRDIAYRAL